MRLPFIVIENNKQKSFLYAVCYGETVAEKTADLPERL